VVFSLELEVTYALHNLGFDRDWNGLRAGCGFFADCGERPGAALEC
jgi:hypothetical protein